jgi:hypothetical protein
LKTSVEESNRKKKSHNRLGNNQVEIAEKEKYNCPNKNI